MKYKEEQANKWIQPVRRSYRQMCCDCGLVHEFDFRIYNGRVQYRVRRLNRSTGQARRWLFRDSKPAN
jgi:hypothetical protein